MLVAEDEPIIALELEAALCDAGYVVLGPVASCAKAFRALRGGHVDCAILDVILDDGDCVGLALHLNELRIPFVLTTGLRSIDLAEQVLRDAPQLAKPFPMPDMLAAVAALIRPHRPE